jgi:hypothetical protein
LTWSWLTTKDLTRLTTSWWHWTTQLTCFGT